MTDKMDEIIKEAVNSGRFTQEEIAQVSAHIADTDPAERQLLNAFHDTNGPHEALMAFTARGVETVGAGQTIETLTKMVALHITYATLKTLDISQMESEEDWEAVRSTISSIFVQVVYQMLRRSVMDRMAGRPSGQASGSGEELTVE